jgi:hypothetical protein
MFRTWNWQRNKERQETEKKQVIRDKKDDNKFNVLTKYGFWATILFKV